MNLLTELSRYSIFLLLCLFCCCCSREKEPSSPGIEETIAPPFEPRYELCYGVVKAILDKDYEPSKLYYLRNETKHPYELAGAKVVFPPGEETSIVTINGRRHVLRKDSCLTVRFAGYAGILSSSMAWDDLRAFDELNIGWAGEMRRTVFRATTKLDDRLKEMEYVAKPDQFITVSVVETYWSDDKLSSTLLYGAHPEEELNAIIQEVENSPLLSKMTDVAKSFSISYPVRYYKKDQMESWAEFEKRMERSKKDSI